MADVKLGKDVSNTSESDHAESKDQIYLEETFYILSKKNSVFRVRLTSKGLSLIKETDGFSKEQIIHLRDIIGSKCMRSKRRRPGAGSCVCSSFIGSQPLKVVDENSGDLDENDISAYLYIYAYILKRSRRTLKRERTTITLRFRSFDKYEDNNKEAQKWRGTIKNLIAGHPPNHIEVPNEKRLLILLNPKSGPGKARELFQTKVAPILQEAEIPYDLHVTKYAQYAREFVRTRNIYNWRGIVAVGGDGVLFEVINGIFERLDWQQAMEEVPLGILPCGSGNGLARTICHLYNEPYTPQNLTGLAMALVRGRSAPMDVVRVETKSKIMFSFLSVGWGLLSDIDIESERLRAIGGQRFAVWSLARLLGLRRYRGVVSYVRIRDVPVGGVAAAAGAAGVAHSASLDAALDSPDAEAFVDCAAGDVLRHQRADSWHSVNSRRSAFYSTRGSEYHSVASAGSPAHAAMHGPAPRLPALTAALPAHWTHERGEFVLVHAAYQAYIGEDFLFAPRAALADGVMWLLLARAGASRSQLLALLLGAGRGAHAAEGADTEHIRLIPVSAFRIEPERGSGGAGGVLTVDGEPVEHGPLQAEIFPNAFNLLVPHD